MPLRGGVLFVLEVGAVLMPMLLNPRACWADSSRSHLPGIVGGPAWSLGTVMSWTAASLVGIALAGAIGLAVPLIAAGGGIGGLEGVLRRKPRR